MRSAPVPRPRHRRGYAGDRARRADDRRRHRRRVEPAAVGGVHRARLRRRIRHHQLRVLHRRRRNLACRVPVRTASPIVISVLSSDGTTPLDQRHDVLVELRAVNAIGAGAASAVATGIAQTTPSAPDDLPRVTPGPSSLAGHVRAGLQRRRGHHRLRVPARRRQAGSNTGTLGNTLLRSAA